MPAILYLSTNSLILCFSYFIPGAITVGSNKFLSGRV